MRAWRSAHRQGKWAGLRGVVHGALLGLLVAAMLLGTGLGSRVAAQQGWMPTVATSPGGSFDGVPPAMVDPKVFPPRGAAPAASNPLPQGAWSPIVTGAIPQPRQMTPGMGTAPVARGATSRDLEPVVGPTPLRPLPAARTAAANAANNATTNAVAAGDSGSSGDDANGVGSAASDDDGTLFKKPGPLDALPPNASAAQQYCFNTADTAADARFAWQAKKIKEMEAALDKKAEELRTKTEEYKVWLERRDAFSRKAHEKLVGFYSRMRPDAAALQLASLDEETAAALVTKLETKVASQIMGEMNPEQAAKIATIISGAAKVPPKAKQAVVAPEDQTPPGSPDEPPRLARPRL